MNVHTRGGRLTEVDRSGCSFHLQAVVGTDMKYRLEDLLDIPRLQSLLDSLYASSKIPSAIIDNDGKIHTGSGWQDACTKFHRVHPDVEKLCIESDKYITRHIHAGAPWVIYKCPQGLVDTATPLVVEGTHIGNVFTGQLFLEPTDIGFFRSQAVRYGWDEEAYLDAVRKIPVIPRQVLQEHLAFIARFTEMLAEIGLKRQREKENEEQRQKEETQARMILQTAMDGFCLMDKQGRILDANEAYCRMSGYDRDELLTMRIRDVEAIESGGDVEERLSTLTSRGEDRFQTVHRRKDGSRFEADVSVQYRPIFGGRMAAFIRDVSERKILEEQLRQSQKMEAVGRLAGGIAHDFNNLLTVIAGYSDLLLSRTDGNSALRKDVEQIKRASERASALTRQLLAFSRKQVLQSKVLDLNELVSQMEMMLRRLIGEDVELRTILATRLWSVKADPSQIEQALVNLVVNGRDAMPKGGVLTIETSNINLGEDFVKEHPSAIPGPHVSLTVTDAGLGMGEEVKAHIFEPFFTTKEKGKGTGLGLSTVYGIVNQSRGHIQVRSEIGTGTTVSIFLPRAEKEAEKLERDLAIDLYGRETVLVVEDEESVREIAKRVLSEKGYRVLLARESEEGIRIFQEHKESIDLVLSDVVMPGMGGREFAAMLEKIKPGTKILYMTGYTDDTILRHGVQDEGFPLVQKPFTPSSLLAKVREVLDGVSSR